MIGGERKPNSQRLKKRVRLFGAFAVVLISISTETSGHFETRNRALLMVPTATRWVFVTGNLRRVTSVGQYKRDHTWRFRRLEQARQTSYQPAIECAASTRILEHD